MNYANTMRKLIIHPEDASTDFLKRSYRNVIASVLTKKSNNQQLEELIAAHDQIIMMGHGSHLGLYHNNGFVFLGKKFTRSLIGKDCICVWCYADSFMDSQGLSGYGTSMIISQMDEALEFGVKCTEEDIQESNTALTHSLSKQLTRDYFNSLDFKLDYINFNIKNPVIARNKYSL